MRTEIITYTRGIGFISRGPEPANYKFHAIVTALVPAFEQRLKELINPAGGIESATFTDYCPDTDELLLSATWRYFGLSRQDRIRADNLFRAMLESMMARSDDLNCIVIGGGGK